MPRTAKQVLDAINDVLAAGGMEAKWLWDLMGAVRGPDSGALTLKQGGTDHIRALAFPGGRRASTLGGTSFAASPNDPFTLKQWAQQQGGENAHFARHIESAAVALTGMGGYTHTPSSTPSPQQEPNMTAIRHTGAQQQGTGNGGEKVSSLKGKFFIQQDPDGSTDRETGVYGRVEKYLGNGIYALRLWKWGSKKERHLRVVDARTFAEGGYVFFNTEEGLMKAVKKVEDGKDLVDEASTRARR